MRPISQSLLLAGVLTFWGSHCFALASDHEQEIIIEADSAEYREPDGVTIYQGNVSVSQGTIFLQSDRITVHSQGGQTTRLVAEGSPANYMQTINEAGDKVIATSDHMEYLIVEGVLTLMQEAKLTQRGTTLSGNQIVYDVQQHVLRASSQGESNNDRVRVTIPAATIRVPSAEGSQ